MNKRLQTNKNILKKKTHLNPNLSNKISKKYKKTKNTKKTFSNNLYLAKKIIKNYWKTKM